MKKRIYVFALLALTALAFAKPDDNVSNAIETAKKFYGTLFSTFQNQNNAAFFGDAKKTLYNIAMGGDEFPMPNDNVELKYEGKTVTIKTYSRYMYDGSVKTFSYQNPKNAKIIIGPSDDGKRYEYTVEMEVEKNVNGRRMTDVVHVNLNTLKVCGVYNESVKKFGENPYYCEIEASKQFEKHNYREAYQNYLKAYNGFADGIKNGKVLNTLYGETCYFLAVMTYQGWGCSDLSKKTRMLKTDEYLDEAIKWGDQEINLKAKRMCQRVNGNKCFTNNL